MDFVIFSLLHLVVVVVVVVVDFLVLFVVAVIIIVIVLIVTVVIVGIDSPSFPFMTTLIPTVFKLTCQFDFIH